MVTGDSLIAAEAGRLQVDPDVAIVFMDLELLWLPNVFEIGKAIARKQE